MLDAQRARGGPARPSPAGAPDAAIEATKVRDVNLPNAITVGRIFLVPLVVWLIIVGRMQAAFVVFVVAGVSDALDGYLAKRFGWQSELGAYLDPLADKALLVSIYVALGYFAHMPAWIVIAVVSRDLLIIGAVLLSVMLGRPVEVHPLPISKANTVGQIVLAALVLGNLGFGLALAGVIELVSWVVGALTVLSAAAYLRAWLAHMTAYDVPQRPAQKASSRDKQGRNLSRGQKHAAGS